MGDAEALGAKEVVDTCDGMRTKPVDMVWSLQRYFNSKAGMS